RPRENPTGVGSPAGYPGWHAARSGKSAGEGAMAWTAARRHLRQTRQLDVLLPARHVPDHFDSPDAHLHAARPSLGPRTPRRAFQACLAFLAIGAFTLGRAACSDAADEIRVGLVEEGRTIEVGGGPMWISDAAGRPLTTETPTWLRALPEGGGVEVRSHGAP